LNDCSLWVSISTVLARCSGMKSLSVFGTERKMGASGCQSFDLGAEYVHLPLTPRAWLSIKKDG
jgi:hypothetical protein